MGLEDIIEPFAMIFDLFEGKLFWILAAILAIILIYVFLIK